MKKGSPGGGSQISIVVPLKCCRFGLSIGDKAGDKVRGNAAILYYIRLCIGSTYDYISDALHIIPTSCLMVCNYNMLRITGYDNNGKCVST